MGNGWFNSCETLAKYMIRGKYTLKNVLFHKFCFFIWNLCSKELILKNWRKLNSWVKCLWELYLSIKCSEIMNGNEYA